MIIRSTISRFIPAAAAASCVASMAGPALAGPEQGGECAAPDVEAGRAERQELRARRCSSDPRVALGQVSYEACLGADLFFRETFGGNGRTCGSCHPAANNYTLDPEFIATLPDSDPLFIAEQVPELGALEVPELLREHALIVVNADGFEDPTRKFVVRSVQHMLGLAVSTLVPTLNHPDSDAHANDGTLLAFAERLGWGGDGAPGEGRLRDFADGAIIQHAPRSLGRQEGVDFFLPNDEERDAIAEFSRSIGRLNDVDLFTVQLSDPGAARGQAAFMLGTGRECGACHTNAGAIETLVDGFDFSQPPRGFGNMTFDVGTEFDRVPAVDELGIMLDGGHGLLAQDLDGDAAADAFGNRAFNVPSLIEAPDTGPMFHTNASQSIEDAIRFYATEAFTLSLAASRAFLNREAFEPVPVSETDVLEIGRFLRVLNTSLNLQMAHRRIDAAIDIGKNFGNREWQIERGLMALAGAELSDALDVLGGADRLHDEEQCRLRGTLRRLDAIIEKERWSGRTRRELDDIARSLEATNSGLGSGLEMQMGQGTLLF